MTQTEPYVKNRTLEDGLFEIKSFLERADFVQQDVEEDYFSYNDPQGHEVKLILEYNRARVKADIVSDYLYKIHQKLTELETYIEQAKSVAGMR